MNFGSIHNPATNAGKLFAILSAEPGKWFDAWDLAMRLSTTCIGTIVSEVRKQLPQELGSNPEHRSPTRRQHYYRLRVGQMELGL